MSKIKVDISFAERVITEEGQAVLGLLELVRQPAFEQVVQLFLKCTGSVIVSGMGKAGIVGSKISATLASTGTASHFLHPAEAVHGDLGRIQTNDIVLALSHSGESEEIVRLIEPLKQREIKLISVVGATHIETADIPQGLFMLVLPIASFGIMLGCLINLKNHWKGRP